MKTIELPSKDRCILLMRDVLMMEPGQQMRSVDLRDVLALHGFGSETISQAVKAAEAEKNLERTGKNLNTRFTWNDDPAPVDLEPQEVVRVSASEKHFFGRKFPNSIAWSLFHCLGFHAQARRPIQDCTR